MLAIFRINDPLRLLLAAAIFLLLRLGWYYYTGLPATGNTLMLQLVGERMAEGKKMYVHIWENTPPLSAGVAWLMHLLFGRSLFAYQLFGAILVIVQAGIFNKLALRYNLYNEKNYLPALFYCLFTLVSFDTATLSPPLLAATPLLLMLSYLLQLRDRVSNEGLFTIGVYAGIAILFYYPTVVFVFFALLASILLRSLSPRQLFIMVLGSLFVCLIITTYYYYYTGNIEELFQNYWLTLLLPERFLLAPPLLILLLGVPSISLLLAVLKVYSSNMYFINFQQTVHNIMLLWLLLVVAAVFLSAGGFSGNAVVLLAPPYAFFITHYFLLLPKKWVVEATAVLLMLALPTVGWLALSQAAKLPDSLKYSYVLPQKPLPLPKEAQRILVLDNRWQYYYGRQQATPYLRPELAVAHLQQLDKYAIAQAVYLNIVADMPDLIIAQTATGSEMHLFKRLPVLQQWYRALPQYPDFYYRQPLPKQ
ncbi:MAG: DUF6427 family protein [Cytophagales bacterium]|nr:glycosyltransferase family 39 protein [Bernardetiaceae bacterium]MDW8205940.1 DUF6427 family protein [Cytophagales bacterium]